MEQRGKIAEMQLKRERFQDEMTNIVKSDPWVPIIMADAENRTKDREYKLEFNFGAAERVFRETGLNFQSGEIQNADLTNLDLFFALLTAGLETHHPELDDPSKVKRLARMKHMGYYTFCIQRAMEATMPDLEQLRSVFGEAPPVQPEGTAEEGSGPLLEEKPS